MTRSAPPRAPRPARATSRRSAPAKPRPRRLSDASIERALEAAGATSVGSMFARMGESERVEVLAFARNGQLPADNPGRVAWCVGCLVILTAAERLPPEDMRAVAQRVRKFLARRAKLEFLGLTLQQIVARALAKAG